MSPSPLFSPPRRLLSPFSGSPSPLLPPPLPPLLPEVVEEELPLPLPLLPPSPPPLLPLLLCVAK